MTCSTRKLETLCRRKVQARAQVCRATGPEEAPVDPSRGTVTPWIPLTCPPLTPTSMAGGAPVSLPNLASGWRPPLGGGGCLAPHASVSSAAE